MYRIYNEDCIKGLSKISDNSIDLVLTDPPYCLGKDYGNQSDMLSPKQFLEWTEKWIIQVIPKLKATGSFYIFTTWRYAPEIFSFMKKHLHMINEIIWDRRVPSMGGSTRRFSSVHDTVGLFVVDQTKYYFNIDAVRVPYDQETKKARTRKIFEGSKWLEMGYNPKDVWSCSRLHKQHKEREPHPTQKPLKIIDRMIKASSPENGIILDPFAGSGTTIVSAIQNNRSGIGFEINPTYCQMSLQRIKKTISDRSLFAEVII